jgi:hypothetical protein
VNLGVTAVETVVLTQHGAVLLLELMIDVRNEVHVEPVW